MGYDYRLMDQLERKALFANVHYKCAFVAAIRCIEASRRGEEVPDIGPAVLAHVAADILAQPWIDKALGERWTAYASPFSADMIRVDGNGVVSGEIFVR